MRLLSELIEASTLRIKFITTNPSAMKTTFLLTQKRSPVSIDKSIDTRCRYSQRCARRGARERTKASSNNDSRLFSPFVMRQLLPFSGTNRLLQILAFLFFSAFFLVIHFTSFIRTSFNSFFSVWCYNLCSPCSLVRNLDTNGAGVGIGCHGQQLFRKGLSLSVSFVFPLYLSDCHAACNALFIRSAHPVEIFFLKNEIK